MWKTGDSIDRNARHDRFTHERYRERGTGVDQLAVHRRLLLEIDYE